MRTDQFAGLPKIATDFLEKNMRPPRICPTCGHVTETFIEQCGTFEGMFGSEYPLRRYPLKHNKFADEFLQEAPWSSGPVHFLGLRLEDGTEYTWTAEEIKEWL